MLSVECGSPDKARRDAGDWRRKTDDWMSQYRKAAAFVRCDFVIGTAPVRRHQPSVEWALDIGNRGKYDGSGAVMQVRQKGLELVAC